MNEDIVCTGLWFKISLLILIGCYSHPVLLAQASVHTSGGNASGVNGTISYSIGQLSNNTLVGLNGTVMEGVQQPYEIIFMPGVDELPAILLNCKVFPNPFTDRLLIRTDSQHVSGYSFELSGLNGASHQKARLESIETELEMAGFPVGIYFITIYKESRAVKSWKVIKK
jgi:hypothetical protein